MLVVVREQDIRNAVRQLDLSGLPVCLHTSLSSFGHIEGGAEAVAGGFLAEGCTVLVPTFSDGFAIPPPPHIRPERNGWNYEDHPGPLEGIGRIFSPQANDITREEMGAVPACVLAHPRRVRGHHALCSFTAVGPKAEQIISCQTSTDVFAPLRALADADGSIVLMGVGLEKMTLIHAAEELAGRRLFIRWANGPDGTPTGVRAGGCSAGFGRLEPTVSPFAKKHQVGQSVWQAYPASETLRAAAQKIQRDPEITHCSNQSCQRCPDALLGGPIWPVRSANNCVERTL